MANQRLLLVSTMALLLGAIGCSAGKATSANSVNPAQSPTAQNQIAQASPNASPDSGQSQPTEGGGRRRRIDWAAAAAQLGTTETNLREASGLPAQPTERPRPNLQAAAAQLNVSEEQLRQALGITIDAQTGQPTRPQTRPNLEAVAQQLGVTEDQLKTALGFPQRGEGQRRERPRLDIAGAAQKLGVTEQQIIDALGIPANRLNDRSPNAAPNSGSPSPDASPAG